ncbi:MAG: hypothetical protein GY703_13810 [Gammaproteobacteria bacterium]|nr:hypothetical protein [Gammaproteobacteria bacterium]
MRSNRNCNAQLSQVHYRGIDANPPLDLYCYRFESKAALKRIEKHGKAHRKWKQAVLEKASRKNSLSAFRKLTAKVDGRRVIVPDPPLIMRLDDDVAAAESDTVNQFLARYR